MRTSSFVQKAFALAVSLGSPIMGAVPIEDLSNRAVKDMRLDPNGFVHVAEDGIARSYAGKSSNGAVIDYTPLSNEQLIKMISSMPVATDCEEEHLMKTFATVNGFAVKDLHQIYHPSTQLRPAIDPARTHWQKAIELEESYDCNVTFEDRHAQCGRALCSAKRDCVDMGCDVCIIAYDMSARFCHDGGY